jgi:hypothetical protein
VGQPVLSSGPGLPEAIPKCQIWGERLNIEEDTASIVACQRGSLVIAASWLDLTVDFSSCRAFRAEFGNGHIRGINSEEAAIELEGCMSVDAPKDFE